VWVKFPIRQPGSSGTSFLPPDASIVIWTTTPWTIPGNRAVCFSSRIAYGLYEITEASQDNWAKQGCKLILASKLAEEVMKAARVLGYKKVQDVDTTSLRSTMCWHPLSHLKFDSPYGFAVPLLDGEHVTDDTGTGFVHTAPGHGRDDFDIWTAY